MKKIFIITLSVLALFAISNQVAAQSKKCLTILPLKHFLNTASIQYEQSLANKGSFLVAAKYGDGLHDAVHLGLKVGYRRYLGSEAFENFFVEGAAGPLYLKERNGSPEIALTIKAFGGYKHVFKKGFTLETGLGTSLTSNKKAVYDTTDDALFNFRLAMGFSW